MTSDVDRYNQWYWEWRAICDERDRQRNDQGLYGPHIAGRFYSWEPYDADDYPVYYIFRQHVVDIERAIQELCSYCSEQWVTFGSMYEPPDGGCAHDWCKGPCKFAGEARHLNKMFCLPPDTYELDGW